MLGVEGGGGKGGGVQGGVRRVQWVVSWRVKGSLPRPGTARCQLLLSPVTPACHTPAGRAGYGFVLYDLTTHRLSLRGCMSLPYGYAVGSAEFEGLLAGLQAAYDAGVRHLAIQVCVCATV